MPFTLIHAFVGKSVTHEENMVPDISINTKYIFFLINHSFNDNGSVQVIILQDTQYFKKVSVHLDVTVKNTLKWL